MKVLFPTDFSENAEKALPIALDITRQSQGELLAFHSYDLPYSDRSMTISLLDVMRENAEKNMALFAEKLSEEKLPFTTEVHMGNPIRLLKTLSKEQKADLIVMGTKGASGLEEILLGSNAASAIQNAQTPVLVVPPSHHFKGFEKILLATDMHFNDIRALKKFAAFANTYDAEITVLFVQDGSEISEDGRRTLDEQLDGLNHKLSIVHGNQVEKEILAKAENSDMDLIAAIHHQYGFFEGLFHQSVTARLAYHSSIPLLALQEIKD